MKTHDLVVCDEGRPGEDLWRARCVCGWESELLPEGEADVLAVAHRHGYYSRAEVLAAMKRVEQYYESQLDLSESSVMEPDLAALLEAAE